MLDFLTCISAVIWNVQIIAAISRILFFYINHSIILIVRILIKWISYMQMVINVKPSFKHFIKMSNALFIKIM